MASVIFAGRVKPILSPSETAVFKGFMLCVLKISMPLNLTFLNIKMLQQQKGVLTHNKNFNHDFSWSTNICMTLLGLI